MPAWPFVDNCDNHADFFYNCLVLLLPVMSLSPCFSARADLGPSRDYVRTEWNGWVDLLPVDYYYYLSIYLYEVPSLYFSGSDSVLYHLIMLDQNVDACLAST
jgi:hypothetical protein